MKRIKHARFLSLTLIFALLLTLLMACSGQSETSQGSTPGDTGASDSNGSGDNTVYKFSFSAHPAATETNTAFNIAWTDAVREATNGRVDITIYASGSLASQAEALKVMESGAVDGAWVYTGSFAGQYSLTDVVSLPMLGIQSAAMGTDMIWGIHHEFPEVAAEIDGYFPIVKVSTGMNALCLGDKKVETAADLKGLNIRVASDVASAVLTRWGANPMSISYPDIYDSMAKKVIDGAVSEYPGLISFGINEVLGNICEMPFQIGTFMLLWRQDSLDTLPQDLKDIVVSMSGEEHSRELARILDEKSDEARQQMINEGISIYALDDTVSSELEALAKDYWNTWVSDASGSPETAQRLLDWSQEFVKNYSG